MKNKNTHIYTFSSMYFRLDPNQPCPYLHEPPSSGAPAGQQDIGWQPVLISVSRFGG